MDDSELMALLKAYRQTPTDEALDTLITAYAPLCGAIARRFIRVGVEFEDLNQVALMALLKALERYDFSRDLKFITYAAPTIAGEVRHYVRDKSSAIRFSRDKMASLAALNKARETMTQALKREPTIKELSAHMLIPPFELLELLRMREAANPLSMDAAMPEADETALSKRLYQLEEGYAAFENKDTVERLYKIVTPQEKALLKLRYEQSMSQREAARALNISQMQVSRIERRVLERLKKEV